MNVGWRSSALSCRT